jgi:hypothetical protein
VRFRCPGLVHAAACPATTRKPATQLRRGRDIPAGHGARDSPTSPGAAIPLATSRKTGPNGQCCREIRAAHTGFLTRRRVNGGADGPWASRAERSPAREAHRSARRLIERPFHDHGNSAAYYVLFFRDHGQCRLAWVDLGRPLGSRAKVYRVCSRNERFVAVRPTKRKTRYMSTGGRDSCARPGGRRGRPRRVRDHGGQLPLAFPGSMRKASGVNEETSPSGNGPWRAGGGTFRMKRTRPAWCGRRERRALTAPDSAAGSPALSDWIRGARPATWPGASRPPAR